MADSPWFAKIGVHTHLTGTANRADARMHICSQHEGSVPNGWLTCLLVRVCVQTSAATVAGVASAASAQVNTVGVCACSCI